MSGLALGLDLSLGLGISSGVNGNGEASFTFTIDTENTSAGSTASDHFALPLVSNGTYNFNVDWGDGNDDDIAAWDDAAKDHTYSVAGEYEVTITGTITGWRFNNTGDRLKMLDVSEWGPFTIGGSTDGGFFGCTNLTSSAGDAPQVAPGVTNFQDMFHDCTVFNADLSSWDVSSGTNFQDMFRGSPAFNADLSSWDVSSATTFQGMFFGCTAFNSDLSSWDVSSVTTLQGMFNSCTAFNSDLSSWDVSLVTSLQGMFIGCTAFNSDLSSWDVSLVTNFQGMFNGCTAFNSDLSSWDVSAGTNFTNFMFGANALSTANYDAILIGWEALDLVDSLSIHFGDAQYSAGAAATARAAIIADDLWTITDGGQVP